jgi:branched-chain amino acid aminotransferase
MQSTNYAYVNGRFVPETEATVSIFDRGFLYGDGCFETMRIYGGKLFRVVEHLDRLFDGLGALRIEPAVARDRIRGICEELIERNGTSEGVARIYVTRDSTVVTARPARFEPGALTAIVSAVQVDGRLSRFKTANRLPYILAQQQATREGAHDAVLLNAAGHVVEFTASNLFVVKGEELFTPPLSDGPLPGITRRAVLALAGEQKIPVHEQSFGPEFLVAAEEVFATNSLMEIAPVTSWGRSHQLTARLQTAYRALVRDELGL